MQWVHTYILYVCMCVNAFIAMNGYIQMHVHRLRNIKPITVNSKYFLFRATTVCFFFHLPLMCMLKKKAWTSLMHDGKGKQALGGTAEWIVLCLPVRLFRDSQQQQQHRQRISLVFRLLSVNRLPDTKRGQVFFNDGAEHIEQDDNVIPSTSEKNEKKRTQFLEL